MIIRINKNQKISDLYNPNGLDYEYPKKIVIQVTDYQSFAFNTHFGNCKMCSFEGLQDCLTSEETATMNRLDGLFSGSLQKLVFFVTYTDEEISRILSNRYQLIYTVKIPIGYESGYQYNSLFMVNNDSYPEYENYIDRIEKEGIELINS